MKPADIENRIAEGESERLEFKTQAKPEDVARSIVAFLNGSGGELLLGVGNDGRVIGLPRAEATAQHLRSELPDLISPPALWTVEPVRVNDRNLLFIEVPQGLDKPYVSGGAIYFRRADKVVPASRDEISHLIRHRAETEPRWERQLAVGAELDDLDERLIRETIRLARDAQRWKKTTDGVPGFLNSLGLIDHGKLTNAALLLYGKEPCRLLPQARVRLLSMPEGKTGDRYTFDRIFDQCLLRTAKELPDALESQIGGVESRFSKQWQRTDRALFPMTTLREGVMNALVHRDYAQSGSVMISVLHTSLRISNPGGLPGELKPSDLKKDHPSLPRNPVLAHVCFLHGLMELVGRGTQRIVEDCRSANLPDPKWESSPLATTLTLFSNIATGGEEELNDRQRLILKELRAQGVLRPTQITQLLGSGVTDRTVRTDLQRLADRGLLIRRGRGRSTSYAVGEEGQKR